VIEEETPDSPLPGFTGIMTMVAMLSAVMIRRRREN
jgi:PGF-CTERM protein